MSQIKRADILERAVQRMQAEGTHLSNQDHFTSETIQEMASSGRKHPLFQERMAHLVVCSTCLDQYKEALQLQQRNVRDLRRRTSLLDYRRFVLPIGATALAAVTLTSMVFFSRLHQAEKNLQEAQQATIAQSEQTRQNYEAAKRQRDELLKADQTNTLKVAQYQKQIAALQKQIKAIPIPLPSPTPKQQPTPIPTPIPTPTAIAKGESVPSNSDLGKVIAALFRNTSRITRGGSDGQPSARFYPVSYNDVFFAQGKESSGTLRWISPDIAVKTRVRYGPVPVMRALAEGAISASHPKIGFLKTKNREADLPADLSPGVEYKFVLQVQDTDGAWMEADARTYLVPSQSRPTKERDALELAIEFYKSGNYLSARRFAEGLTGPQIEAATRRNAEALLKQLESLEWASAVPAEQTNSTQSQKENSVP